ncbi:MAG: ABC transporter substrate-binding protein [Vibrio sp.]
MKKTLIAISLFFSLTALANESWNKIEAEAKGQTVYFNAWGGDENTNSYIDWASKQAKDRYGITVKHVKVTDSVVAVKRIKEEANAGRKNNGSVDLIWINGENFKALKQDNLLFGPWAENLPNWKYVDLEKPVQIDFSEPVDGLEMPWGFAQLTFLADRRTVINPPRSAQELAEFARANQGQVSYPKPPNFHGTTFLKQLLIELTPNAKLLQQPVDPETSATVAQPLWDYLDKFHPNLWRKGNSFPSSASDMRRMLGDGELKLSLTFNPNEAAFLISSKQLPASVYSFGFSGGMISNVHFVAIPSNAKSKAAAQVFANFLLSPEAQAKKADLNVWGDSSVLALDKISGEYAKLIEQTVPGALTEAVIALDEPHASWVDFIETEWIKRYGAQ